MGLNYLEKIVRQVILRVYVYMEETGRKDSFERFPYLEMFVQRGSGRGHEPEEGQGQSWHELEEGQRQSWHGLEEGQGQSWHELEEGQRQSWHGLEEEQGQSWHELEEEQRQSWHEPEEGQGASSHKLAVKGGEARYEALLHKLSDGEKDGVLKNVVDLALAAAFVTEFAAYLNYYTGNRATIQLAYEISGEFCPDYAEVKKYWKRLERAFCVEKKNPIGYANIEADHELLFYLTGDPAWNGVFGGEAERFCHKGALHPMYVREELADQGEKLLAGGNTILHVCGSGGKRFLVKHIAKRMGRDVLFIRMEQLCGEGENEEYRRMQTLRRAFLNDCMICVREGRQKSSGQWETEAAELSYALRAFSEAGINVILCTEKATAIPAAGGSAAPESGGTAATDSDRIKTVRIELTPLSRAERSRVWMGFAEQYGLKEDVKRCSIQYKLGASEIARAVMEWAGGQYTGKDEDAVRDAGSKSVRMPDAGSGAGGKSVCPTDDCAVPLSDICYRILCTGEKQKLGTVIKPRVGFSGLIVSERVKRTLKEICCGAVQGYRIYEEWGLDQQYPYGKSVSLLLAGPPGTGKTMTAHVLAHEIGVPLYQVDLSHVMDKYIGETEKHLEQVFDFALKTNMVLFFDEADALFAKRGEVTEGKDRYANMEVSYLLQRMEQFDGVVILATNFYHHIDKAFLRRIKYVLKYQEPDEEMRKQMWESCLVPALPREAIDTDYLARQFALSGGAIKNVIQSACISAVYENRPLRMEHVLGAVRMEYEKIERNMAPGFWGEYEYLMERECF